MKALLQLCRLHYSLPFPLAYGLTVYYARGGRMEGQWSGLVLSMAALGLVIAGGYVLNDVFDLDVDRISAPRRPLPAGRIRRKTAGFWGGGLLFSGILVGASCRPGFLLTLAALAAGLVYYNARSKRLGVGKQILVALLTTSIYPLALAQAGGASGPRALTLAVFPAWLLLTSFSYEILKDIRDIPGDRSAAPIPSPHHLQLRPYIWRNIANASILLGAVLLVGPYLLGCGWIYLAITLPAMGAAVASVFLPTRAALAAIYTECALVGTAATADVLVLGV